MESKTIQIYGGHHFMDTESLLAGQMKNEYFPVKLEELPAAINYYDLFEDPIKINDATIYHTHLLHPELSLGFRVEYQGKVFVYATDNELVTDIDIPEFNIDNIGLLIKDADLLVAECQYTNKEYPEKVGWGHSTIEGVIDISTQYGVKNLYTFHHDPYHNDEKLDEMLADGKKRAGKKLNVFASRDGMEVKM
jgi:ribonuclease BN (tRNA processing enzyme)